MPAIGTIYDQSCFPDSNEYFSSGGGEGCCARCFNYTQVVEIPNVNCTTFSSNYYPNRCSGNPKTPTGTIGPMPIDSEVLLNFYSVDDDLVINGSIYEPNQHLVTLGSGNTGNCTTFEGGLSTCNGAHAEFLGVTFCAGGKLVATIPKGGIFSAYGQDNHGIVCFLLMTVVVVPVDAP